MLTPAPARLRTAPCLLVCALVCVSFEGLSHVFVGLRPAGRELGVDRNAYQPILRRDPLVNKELQKWARQQLRLVKRQEAGGWSEPDEKKKEYLRKLGLDKKAEQLDQKKLKPAWHLNHIAPGDKFVGTFEHPDLFGGEAVDLTFEAVSDSEANIVSKRGDLDDTVDLQQDYPIAFEAGEQKDQDMVAYTFHKFNEQWREFEKEMPAEEDCQHITLPMLRLFFKQAPVSCVLCQC